MKHEIKQVNSLISISQIYGRHWRQSECILAKFALFTDSPRNDQSVVVNVMAIEVKLSSRWKSYQNIDLESIFPWLFQLYSTQ